MSLLYLSRGRVATRVFLTLDITTCKSVSYTGVRFWHEKKGWGYGESPKTEEEFVSRYEGLTKILLSHPRVCGFCYTQLTDVEQEQNGMYYYDRGRKLSDESYERICKMNKSVAEIEK